MAAISVAARTDGPWADVTLSGFSAGSHTVIVWRTAAGERVPVRGTRNLEVIDSGLVVDYDVPMGWPATYEVEVLSGPDAGALVPTASLTYESPCGYLHDPLDPTVAVPVWATRAPNGEPVLASGAFAELVRGADVSVHRILGSRHPVAIGGQRAAAAGVDLSVMADAELQNTRLRDMTSNSTVLVARLLPGWLNGAFPPVAYLSVPEVLEQPVTAGRGLAQGFGQHLTRWQMVGQIVRPATGAVLVALFTYQDVEDLFDTYEQKQIAAGGGTYLDDMKQPLG
ncbi:minor tail protein [Arthrobacter phage Kuleana]|uniref:Minor tail protein n=1 Tax=Arthrobacter phage Kuleana TaxID=2653270 RepID=A0A5Q2WE23_9CAUD|nr:minor tail protein [Arthrobacter phage Kuleana]QGH74504.1 minor tail protein [Arthrobacter phage Kuleana]